MSKETHSNNAQAEQTSPDNWFVDALKKQAVVVFCAAAFGAYQFFWNSHDSSKDVTYQIESLKEKVQRLQDADKEKTETMNNFLIAITKVSEAQNRLADDVKAIQAQQQKNTEMLFNRK